MLAAHREGMDSSGVSLALAIQALKFSRQLHSMLYWTVLDDTPLFTLDSALNMCVQMSFCGPDRQHF